MVLIREAKPEDASALGELHVASWRWAYAGLLPDDLLRGLSAERRAARWQQILADDAGSTTFVADDAGSVVGFVSVGPSRDDGDGPGAGELVAIYLLPAIVGTGVGRLLHDAGVDCLRARGFVDARVWVLRGNVRARAFYERCGWRLDGSEKLETGEGGVDFDEVRYTRSLKIPTTA